MKISASPRRPRLRVSINICASSFDQRDDRFPHHAGRACCLPYLILPRVSASRCSSTTTFLNSHTSRTSSFPESRSEIQDQVRLRIETSTTLLRSGTGLFAASEVVDAGEFERFVQQIELRRIIQAFRVSGSRGGSVATN